MRGKKLEALPRVGFVPAPEARWETGEPFGRRAPLAVEVGCGNGHFLAELAQHNPDQDYLGIDLRSKRIAKSCRKVEKKGLTNLKFVLGDANQVLRTGFGAASLSTVYVNFPDPWPKYRHRRHRLNQRPFLQLALSRLAPGGSLMWASDYYPQILDVLHLCRPWLEQGLLENSLLPDGFCEALPGYQPSLYEQKWRSLGLQIFYVRLRCREPVPES